MRNLSDRLKETMETKSLMKNASPSQEDDGSMIRYWEESTGIYLSRTQWTCPKCKKNFSRAELDGAHVVYALGENTPQFITPLCQGCNRGKDESPFWVDKTFLVPAP